MRFRRGAARAGATGRGTRLVSSEALGRNEGTLVYELRGVLEYLDAIAEAIIEKTVPLESECESSESSA